MHFAAASPFLQQSPLEGRWTRDYVLQSPPSLLRVFAACMLAMLEVLQSPPSFLRAFAACMIAMLEVLQSPPSFLHVFAACMLAMLEGGRGKHCTGNQPPRREHVMNAQAVKTT